MTQPGPKPLPANVHRLRGNPSKKAAGELLDEVRPPVEIPKPGAHLSPYAKAEWKRITPLLAELGLVAEIDKAALEVYCQAYALWKEMQEKIRELNKADPKGRAGFVGRTPSGYEQISIEMQISNRSVEQMHKFLTEFGMTPSARSRVTPSDVQPFLPGLEPVKGGEPAPKRGGFAGL